MRVSELVTLPGLITRQANTWIGLNLSEKYSQLKMSPRRFRPSGETKQKQPLVSPDPSGPLNGVVVVSGRSPRAEPGKEKKLEYVFSPFDDGRKPHALTSKSFDKFEQVHTKTGRGDERVAEGSWAELKKRFETKPLSPIPVFYTGDISNQGDDFAFGLTRLFKVPHRVKQGGMIKQKLGTDENQMDMVEALFGFVREGKRAPALKSRVAFSGAVISQEKAEVRGQDNAAPFETVMGTPKASFAPYYLEGKVKDWSVDQKMFPNNDTKIAGRKRYLPRAEGRVDMNHALENIRQRFQTQVDVLSDGARNATKTKSKMRFLVGKTGQPFKFESVIQLHNVSKAEIGLLLLAACFGGGDAQQKCRHMLGRAKPFGAGQLRVVTATLNIKENFDSKNFGDTIPTEAECLSALVAHMKTQGIESYPDTDIVREFLGSADPRNGKLLPGSSDTNEPIYLKLKEHQNMRQKVGKLKTSGASTTQTISVLRANKWKGTIGP